MISQSKQFYTVLAINGDQLCRVFTSRKKAIAWRWKTVKAEHKRHVHVMRKRAIKPCSLRSMLQEHMIWDTFNVINPK